MNVYAAIMAKVQGAETIAELRRAEVAAVRIYNAGLLSVSQLRAVDVRIMERIAAIETA